MDLINQLSEMANDESTTQDAINAIVSKIKGETAQNIKEEIARAENCKEEDLVSLPKENAMMKEAIRKKMDEIRERSDFPPVSPKLNNDENLGPGIIKFGDSSINGYEPTVSTRLLFTRIREVKKPCKAHPTDAGIDFFVPDAKAWDEDFMKTVMKFSRNPIIDGIDGVSFKDGKLIVAPGAHVAIPSGIKTIIPQGYGMMMVNKSGIATKLKLDHSACLIDSEYRDELIFCFFNHNHTGPVEIEPGMKITQGLIVPIIDLGVQEVLNCVYDDLAQAGNDRGGGFGSSGK